MNIFHTADPHLGHVKIIGYCNRPFANVDEMNAALVRNWNETVGPRDMVFVHGDVALATKNLVYIKDLNGIKVLIAGNHDTCWMGRRGWWEAVDLYLAAGFDTVVPEGVVREWHLGAELAVDLSHLPYVGDSTDTARHADQRPTDEGRVLLCGHVHTAWKTSGRQINVGVDVWDYRPVSEYELLEIAEGMQ